MAVLVSSRLSFLHVPVPVKRLAREFSPSLSAGQFNHSHALSLLALKYLFVWPLSLNLRVKVETIPMPIFEERLRGNVTCES